MCEQAQRVMYVIIRKNRNLILQKSVNLICFIRLTLVFTVYGYELNSGFENLDIIKHVSRYI